MNVLLYILGYCFIGYISLLITKIYCRVNKIPNKSIDNFEISLTFIYWPLFLMFGIIYIMVYLFKVICLKTTNNISEKIVNLTNYRSAKTKKDKGFISEVKDSNGEISIV